MGTKAQPNTHQHFLTLSMAQIKLTYFNLRARAEPARLLLAHAGVKYEDRRIPAPWDNPAPWTAMKPTTPYGQCPLLEWDGEVIANLVLRVGQLPNIARHVRTRP